jgi:hypothetical protein
MGTYAPGHVSESLGHRESRRSCGDDGPTFHHVRTPEEVKANEACRIQNLIRWWRDFAAANPGRADYCAERMAELAAEAKLVEATP